jgi:hypothetical protein
VVGFECSKREGVTDTLARELDVQVFELNPALAWRKPRPDRVSHRVGPLAAALTAAFAACGGKA